MSPVLVLRYGGTLKNWSIETGQLNFALWSFPSSGFLVLNQRCFAEVSLKAGRLGIQRKFLQAWQRIAVVVAPRCPGNC